MKSTRVIMTVINDLVGDQRVRRMAQSLTENGCDVLVVGRKLPDSLPLAPRPFRMKRMRLWFQKGKLFYLEMNLRLFLLGLFAPVDVFHANDLDTLLPCFLLSRLRRKALVYDSHEYFTEVPELIHRKRTRAVWLWLEKILFPRLRYVFTVNQALAELYTQKYQVPVKALRNLPYRRLLADDRTPSQAFTLIYQGALNVGRGIELMIDTMAFLPDMQLWIVGKGDVEADLRKRVKEKQLTERVQFLGFVPMDQLPDYTTQASLGLSLEEDLGENYRLASPNKVYDYVQDGVPVLVSDLPMMADFVEGGECGWVVRKEDRRPEKLAALILRIADPQSGIYQIRRLNCLALAKHLNWENEQQILLESYRELSERH
ncbi:MAG: glycosyltransferase [Bacteroidota bacterium]